MTPATVVLVHGLCGTPDAWSRVVPLLDDSGVPNVAVRLPSCTPGSREDDVAGVHGDRWPLLRSVHRVHAPHDDGFEFDSDELTAYFLGRGWSAADAEEFVAGRSPQRAAASVLEATHAAWRSVPSTFVSCSESEMSRELRALFSSRATDVVEMSGDHFPNWRRPDEVADIVARVAADVVRE